MGLQFMFYLLCSDYVILQLNCSCNEKLLIGNFYRSPNSSMESDEELHSLIKSMCSRFTRKNYFHTLIGLYHLVLAVPAISVTSFCIYCKKNS